MSDINRIKERIQFCIEGELWDQIPSFLNDLHPADIAEIINRSSEGIQNILFELVDKEIKPDVMAALDHQAELDVLEELTDEERSKQRFTKRFFKKIDASGLNIDDLRIDTDLVDIDSDGVEEKIIIVRQREVVE